MSAKQKVHCLLPGPYQAGKAYCGRYGCNSHTRIPEETTCGSCIKWLQYRGKLPKKRAAEVLP